MFVTSATHRLRESAPVRGGFRTLYVGLGTCELSVVYLREQRYTLCSLFLGVSVKSRYNTIVIVNRINTYPPPKKKDFIPNFSDEEKISQAASTFAIEDYAYRKR